MSIYKTPKNFEDAMIELEKITNLMQQNNLALEKCIEYYDIGKKLVEFCKNKLSDAEQKLQVLENNELQNFTIEPNEK